MKKINKILFCAFAFFIFSNYAKADELIDGIYTIETISNKVVEADSNPITNMTNVQINKNTNSDNQKWKIQSLNNGYYKITSLDSNFNMDVTWGGYSSGTNVWMYYSNNSNSQAWYLKETSDGYFNIISKHNNLYLDVSGGGSKDGTNIQVYNGNGSNAQKFKLIEQVESKKTLEDGDYIIHTNNYNQVIDLSGANTANHAKIQTYDLGLYENHAQIWHLKYLSDGYYSITSSLDNNKALDLTDVKEVSGNKVQLYQNSENSAQKWILKDAGNGYYNILTIGNHKYLDVSGGVARNFTQIQVYRGNGTNAQKFKFEKIEYNKLEDGFYKITSKLSNDKVIGIESDVAINGINVALKDSSDSNTQKWYVKNLGSGIYSITSAVDLNKSLDVSGGNKANHSNIQIYNSNNTNAQRWYIKYVKDGYYTVISQLGYSGLDVDSANISDGTNIQLYGLNYSDAQLFKFDKTEKNDLVKSYEDGYYQISSLLDNSKVLDVNGGIVKNSTNIQLYNNNSTLAQVWYLKYLNDGYYSITSALNKNVSIDAQGGGITKGTNVQAYKWNGSDAQKWLVKDYGNGVVAIVSKLSGLYVDVAGGVTSNGTNIQLYSNNGSNAQRFKLTKYTDKKVYKGIDVSKHQGDINWNQVSNSGVNFAILRLGFGAYDSQEDAKLLEYVKGCEENNISYAFYLYSYADGVDGEKGAKAEAQFSVRVLNKLKNLGYTSKLNTTIFYDMEDKSTVKGDKDYMTSLGVNYCSVIEQNGYSCGIYANKNWYENILNGSDLANKYKIWLAHYTGPDDYYNVLSKPSNYSLSTYNYWQFSSLGQISGIKTNVDLDYGYNIFD